MLKYLHGANNIDDVKRVSEGCLYNGCETDIHLTKDKRFVVGHNFNVGNPLVKGNWIKNINSRDLKEFQKDGEYNNMEMFIDAIGSKEIILDIKNWLIILGYAHKHEALAESFLEEINNYLLYNNILVQSYDHILMKSIIDRIRVNTSLKSNLKMGLIIRDNMQFNSAMKIARTTELDFLSIRQQIVDKKNVDFIRNMYNFKKIFGWYEPFDKKLTEQQQIDKTMNSGCDGIICSSNTKSLIKTLM